MGVQHQLHSRLRRLEGKSQVERQVPAVVLLLGTERIGVQHPLHTRLRRLVGNSLMERQYPGVVLLLGA